MRTSARPRADTRGSSSLVRSFRLAALSCPRGPARARASRLGSRMERRGSSHLQLRLSLCLAGARTGARAQKSLQIDTYVKVSKIARRRQAPRGFKSLPLRSTKRCAPPRRTAPGVAAVSETVSSSPWKSALVPTGPLIWVLAGERLANEHGLNPLDFVLELLVGGVTERPRLQPAHQGLRPVAAARVFALRVAYMNAAAPARMTAASRDGRNRDVSHERGFTTLTSTLAVGWL